MKKLSRKNKREVTRFTEYLVSGGAYFWVGYGVFFIDDKILHLTLFPTAISSSIIGWSVNFALQRFWVFNNPKLAKHQLEVTSRYILLSVFNWLLNYVILRVLKNIGITPYIGQFLSAGFFTVWNYAWYRLWVFPDKFPRKKHA